MMPSPSLHSLGVFFYSVRSRSNRFAGIQTMAPAAERQIRISQIGGRFLVFDLDDVVHIRRHHSTCAVFIGTMPQNPTQNIFLGLPIELYAEEARLLLDKKAAYLVDDTAEHLSQLTAMDSNARRAYLDALKAQRKTAQLMFDDAKAKARALHEHKRKGNAKKPLDVLLNESGNADGEDLLFESQPPKPAPVVKAAPIPAVTPTISNLLITPRASVIPPQTPTQDPLLAYLNSKGYYITPGLRFGGDYSVYPGDPFRYHAHYMANSYGWSQGIPMLDLVTSGRLGTAVKKAFLFGAKQPMPEEGDAEGDAAANVRVFCIEWAGM